MIEAGASVAQKGRLMSSAPTITNIIVLMLENRSYDNVLGWLYNPGNAPPYDQAPPGQANLNGLTGGESNPNPDGGKPITISNSTTTIVDGQVYPGTVIPGYDPGEGFCDMTQQIFGLPSIPDFDPYLSSKYQPNMQGFTTNYAALSGKQQVPKVNYPDCMNYFTPDQIPVSAFLAYNFAVCDQWFASVPCQTFTNRNFVHCAGPAVHSKDFFHDAFSMVNDLQYECVNGAIGPLAEMPSIFSQLDAAYPSSKIPNWKLYFHDYPIALGILPYVYKVARGKNNVNVATYDNSDWGSETPAPFRLKLGAVPPTFMDDLAAGTLPKFSFIEPRYSETVALYSNPANSNHPGRPSSSSPPTDVANGEIFVMQLYNALRNSATYWNSTLLIITYDEHGGVYDHVPPPATAVSPGPDFPPASDDDDHSADGFVFKNFGCRVPAIVVSPFIAAGSTIRAPSGYPPFDHTSIIKTVWECFNLSSLLKSNSLTNRDAAAPSLMPFLSATANNSTGPFPGPIGQPASAQAPKIPRQKTKEEELALFRERLEKSARRRV
jgi:phospholipase C